jgi:probable F420-dependent oxidoreductase
MKFGIFGVNMGPAADPAVAREVAVAAEDAGFDSLWAGEHVVLPDPQAPPSPSPPDAPMVDPLVAFGYLAACTSRVLLATGIIILPQRNPLVLAKQLASLDVMSGGRVVFGLGVGYLGAEFEALGVPMERRGARSDEYLEAMTAIWSQEQPAYNGEFVRFSSVQARPRPVQQPSPRIVVGGHSKGAWKRAVQRAHGWYGFALNVEQTAANIEGLRQAEQEVKRPDHFGPLEITVSPRGKADEEAVARFTDLGVDRLVLLSRPGEDPRQTIEAAAPLVAASG